MSGGDDYELFFTETPEYEEKIRVLSAQFATPITAAGRAIESSKLIVRDINGTLVPLSQAGYKHF
ncbi:MAG TPA: hypothetical protein VLC91_13735 [Spongiibacteraceae bacterium]|nr:hypothetical protein [Spongiibacteraceae bacterium]